MNTEIDDRDLSIVPLQRAVFCVDCEMVSNSPHEACTVCGSPSLISHAVTGWHSSESNCSTAARGTTGDGYVQLGNHR
jgi:hypothetical protein